MSSPRQARLLIAPQAFKGTLSARRVAAAMARGACAFARGRISLSLDVCPMADGGDGSLDALVASGYTRVMTTTRGATGERRAAFVAVADRGAAVEIANACGLARQVPIGLDPLGASSHGLGDAIHTALEGDPATLTIFLGGSASTDGGAGMLQALGARLRDANGDEVHACGRSLKEITTLDVASLDPRLAGIDIVIATDVTSPLTGDRGAAYVFAPQKGATPDDVITLDAGLRHWRRLLADVAGVDAADEPGAGAAGGVGAAAMAVLRARRRSGFDAIAESVGLDARIAEADAVLTGEGTFDHQSTLGKGTGRLLAQAQKAGIPAGLVCGRIDFPAEDLGRLGAVAGVAQGHDGGGASSAVETATTQVVSRLLQ